MFGWRIRNRPPGRRTRCASRSAVRTSSLLVKCSKTLLAKTTSTLAAGRQPRSCALPGCTWPPGAAISEGSATRGGAEERLERLTRGAPIVASREHLLEPDVEDDEEVAAPHLLKEEARGAVLSLAPADRHRLVRVAAHDRLQRQL